MFDGGAVNVTINVTVNDTATSLASSRQREPTELPLNMVNPP
jgi:hypothetical protein